MTTEKLVRRICRTKRNCTTVLKTRFFEEQRSAKSERRVPQLKTKETIVHYQVKVVRDPLDGRNIYVLVNGGMIMNRVKVNPV